MSHSTILLDYTGKNLKEYIDRMMGKVIQVVPISKFRINSKTGIDSRDYLLIYNQS